MSPVSQEFFSTYQSGEDMEEAFRAAQKNALIYHGTYRDNGSISTVRNVRLWQKDMVPRNYAARLASRFKEEESSMAFMAGEECLAVPVEAAASFRWREIKLLLFLKGSKAFFSEEDIYRAIEEHPLVDDGEMVTSLKVKHISEEVDLVKTQGTLLEEECFLLAREGELKLDNIFSSAAEAEEEAIRMSGENGGTYSVFLLNRGSDGQPLFQSTLKEKRQRLEVNVELAQGKGGMRHIGWQFFGFGLS